MRILHICTGVGDGGAFRAAYLVHVAVRAAGHDSTMFVLSDNYGHPNVQPFNPPMDFYSRVRRRWRKEKIFFAFRRYKSYRSWGAEIFSDDRTEHGSDLLNQIPSTDVITLHWISGMIDYQSILVPISQRAPLVWKLDDMNPFTGGCHYDMGCGRFKESCGLCPQLGSKRVSDLSRKIWKRKRAVFDLIEPKRLHLVANNQWMLSQVKSSSLLSDFPITIIPNGLNTNDFFPRDRRLARDLLGLPLDAKILLFISCSLENRRKGFIEIKKALAGLSDYTNLFLATLGCGSVFKDSPIPYLNLGTIFNDRAFQLVYNAADLLVIPSLEDNMPNTVLESLACGTPVVGFHAGGIPEMVRPGITGLLAPVGDSEALRTAIMELLEDPEKRQEMSNNCRRIAVEEYSLEALGRNYSQLYQQVALAGT